MDNMGVMRSRSLLILIGHVLLLLFFVIVRFTDVYRYKVTGAVYEILWLPALASLFMLPVLCILQWKKEKFALRSLNVISLLMVLIMLALLFS